MRELGLLGLGLAFLTLAGCAGAKSEAPSNYCLGEPRDGFDDYAANHADNIAEEVLNQTLVILRDYDSQRFQLATASETCALSGLPRSPAELGSVMGDAAQNASYPPPGSPQWCTIRTSIDNVQVDEGSGLLFALYLAGFKGVGVVTSNTTNYTDVGEPSGSWVEVSAADSCAAVRSVARAMLSRRSELLALHAAAAEAARERGASRP
jgi:hypothetical protein